MWLTENERRVISSVWILIAIYLSLTFILCVIYLLTGGSRYVQGMLFQIIVSGVISLGLFILGVIVMLLIKCAYLLARAVWRLWLMLLFLCFFLASLMIGLGPIGLLMSAVAFLGWPLLLIMSLAAMIFGFACGSKFADDLEPTCKEPRIKTTTDEQPKRWFPDGPQQSERRPNRHPNDRES
ncbi:MAG: hypothetical protein ABFD54_13955 [Armatimonadota bacterium]|nr:hypothetical protein [bacterium]